MGLLSSLSNSLLNLDFVAPSHKLTFRESEYFSSIFGVLFSIAAFLLTFLSITDSLSDFINGNNPIIIDKYNLETNESRLTSKEFFVFLQFTYFNLESRSLMLLDSDQIPTPPVYNRRFRNESSIYYDGDDSPMIRCDDYLRKHYNDNLDEANKINGSVLERAIQSTYCINPNDLNFTMKIDNLRQKSFGISLPIAFSQLTDKHLFILTHISFINTNLVPDRSNKPYQKIWKTIDTSIVKNTYTYYNFSLRKRTILVENSSFLFQNVQAQPFQDYQVVDYNNALNNPVDGNYFLSYPYHMDINFTKDDSDLETTIRYLMLNSVIADFGGTFGVILYLLNLVYRLFFDFSYKTTLINSFFKFHKIIVDNDKALNKIVLSNSKDNEKRDLVKSNLVDENISKGKISILELINKNNRKKKIKTDLEMNVKDNPISNISENKNIKYPVLNKDTFANIHANNANRVFKTDGDNYNRSNDRYLLENNNVLLSKKENKHNELDGFSSKNSQTKYINYDISGSLRSTKTLNINDINNFNIINDRSDILLNSNISIDNELNKQNIINMDHDHKSRSIPINQATYNNTKIKNDLYLTNKKGNINELRLQSNKTFSSSTNKLNIDEILDTDNNNRNDSQIVHNNNNNNNKDSFTSEMSAKELEQINMQVKKRVSIHLYNIHLMLQSKKSQEERLNHLSSIITKVYSEDKLERIKLNELVPKNKVTTPKNISKNNPNLKNHNLSHNLSREIKDFMKEYRKKIYVRYKEVFIALMKSYCCPKRMSVKDKIINKSIESLEYVTSFENISKLFFDNVIIKQYLEISSSEYFDNNKLSLTSQKYEQMNKSSNNSHFSQLYNMLKMPSLNVHSPESIKILNTIISNYREFNAEDNEMLVDYLNMSDAGDSENNKNQLNNKQNKTNKGRKNNLCNCRPYEDSISLDMNIVDYVNRDYRLNEDENINEIEKSITNPSFKKNQEYKMKLFKNYLKNFV